MKKFIPKPNKYTVANLYFNLEGSIRVAPPLMEAILEKSDFQEGEMYYLHLFTSDDPKNDTTLGIQINGTPEGGLPIRIRVRIDRIYKEFKLHSKSTVLALADIYDWPIGNGRNTRVIYTLTDEKKKDENGNIIHLLK